MYSDFKLLIILSLIIGNWCQIKDDLDLPPARQGAARTLRPSFESQFTRGVCPPQFYQLGNECVYYSPDGKIYSWRQAERVCSQRVARMLESISSPNLNQMNVKPTNGVRQLVLNTPEKTEMLRAFYQEYSEQNYAVRLPEDYNSRRRCMDGQDDKWPHYCTSNVSPNSTCFETTAHSPADICLREVDCNQRYLRVACEFTIPGKPELVESTFRHCPYPRQRFRRLPIWAWILIAVGSAILLLALLAGLITFICKSKKRSKPKKTSFPEPRVVEMKTTRVTTTRKDPATEPMLTRLTTTRDEDQTYLEPNTVDRAAPPLPVRARANDNTTNA